MDECGIDKGLALGVGIKASVVAKTNEFIGTVPRDRLIPFGTVHPELSVEENLRHLRDNGIVGVKLHPLFQDLSLADPRVLEILAALAEEGMPVVSHVGAGGDEAANERGRPELLRQLADELPDLKLIACHFGGYHLLDEAEEHVGRQLGHPRDLVAADPGRPRAGAGRRADPPARRRPGRLRLRLADGRPRPRRSPRSATSGSRPRRRPASSAATWPGSSAWHEQPTTPRRRSGSAPAWRSGATASSRPSRWSSAGTSTTCAATTWPS